MSKDLTVQSTLLFFFKYQNCIQVVKHGSRSVNLKNKDTIIYRFPASVFDQLFRYLLVLPYTGIDLVIVRMFYNARCSIITRFYIE